MSVKCTSLVPYKSQSLIFDNERLKSKREKELRDLEALSFPLTLPLPLESYRKAPFLEVVVVDSSTGSCQALVTMSARSTSDLYTRLTELYGEELIGTIFLRYQLFGKSKLTLENAKNIVTGIAANVKVSDLKLLFQRIQGVFGKGVMDCVQTLTPVELCSLKSVQNFEDLSQEQIGFLLKPFRSGMYDSIPLLHTIYPKADLDEFNQGFFFFNCPGHDGLLAHFLTNGPQWFDKTVPDFSSSEFLAKHIGYLELKEGMIIPLMKAPNQFEYFQVEMAISDRGVIATILVPVQTSAAHQEVHVVFRGTAIKPCMSQSLYSLMRDLDPFGIGRTDFANIWPRISRSLQQYMGTGHIRDVRLCFHGHSLAGTDVQRCTAAVASEMRWRGGYSKVSELFQYAHNSPGIEIDVNDNLRKNLAEMATWEKSCIFDTTYFCYETDPIQNFGDVYLGAHIEGPNFVSKVLRLRSPGAQLIQAHREFAYVPLRKSPAFTQEVVNEPEQQEAVMARKAYKRKRCGSYIIGLATGLARGILQNALFYGLRVVASLNRRVGIGGRTDNAVHPSYY